MEEFGPDGELHTVIDETMMDEHGDKIGHFKALWYKHGAVDVVAENQAIADKLPTMFSEVAARYYDKCPVRYVETLPDGQVHIVMQMESMLGVFE